ncbi:MAG: ABC transporter ATP-binding protein [Oscillospiraceae bacterium]|nr:ABC transporter ATP-binding protein [Oscillospiraceae bacterium]
MNETSVQYREKPSDSSELVLSLKNVRKSFKAYGTETEVLRGIDFEIYKNEVVVILGASGCGKTTLLNVIGGLDQADSGSIVCDGQEIIGAKEKQLVEYRRKTVGFVFQYYSLMPKLNVIENLQYVKELVKSPLDEETVLKRVGMWDHRKKFPNTLSAGQQQRTAIARALIKQPHIVLADEPTGALDYQNSIEVLALMQELACQGEATILIVTHNPEIAKIADKVIYLKQGKVSEIVYNKERLSAKDLRW